MYVRERSVAIMVVAAIVVLMVMIGVDVSVGMGRGMVWPTRRFARGHVTGRSR